MRTYIFKCEEILVRTCVEVGVKVCVHVREVE